jgi:hypothetical protein
MGAEVVQFRPKGAKVVPFEECGSMRIRTRAGNGKAA